MADYLDLRGLFNDSDLNDRVQVAVIIAANNLISGTPTADQTNWAAAAFTRPGTEAAKALMAVLAANAGLTLAQIQGASDAAVQTNVDAVVPTLVAAYAAENAATP